MSIDLDFGKDCQQHEYSRSELKALHCKIYAKQIKELRSQGVPESEILDKLSNKKETKILKVKHGHCRFCGEKKRRRFRNGGIKPHCDSRACKKAFAIFKRKVFDLKKYRKRFWQKLRMDSHRHEIEKRKNRERAKKGHYAYWKKLRADSERYAKFREGRRIYIQKYRAAKKKNVLTAKPELKKSLN